VNDFGIWGEVIPGASGQETIFGAIFGSHAGVDYLTLYFSGPNLAINKRSGGNILVGSPHASTVNEPFQYQLFQSRVYGMGIRVKEQGGAWSAWALKNDADGRLDAPIAATYSVGSRNAANHFSGYYPGLAIIQHPDPKAELERLTLKYGA
jgi:hypothetical protein